MRFFQNKYLNGLTWAAAIGVFGSLGGMLGLISVILANAWFGDDSHLKKTTIMARINEETTIYCLDEQTPIGSFFNSEHRQYTTVDQIPKNMINALVAAEDKNFFQHKGVDPSAILKAVVEGLQTGKFRGGSTLTQQTVKNIMDRWEYSIRRKINEAIAALQIEKLYSKEQILEFYLNQFHVSGNGSGIGIAAKYYFNKDVKDLDLVESAFIAGSVKGPSKYDPFLKYTKERREIAVRNAFHRKNYVLDRMKEKGWVTAAEYKEAFEKPVPFNRGSFRSSEVAMVSLIRNQVTQREVLDAIQMEDSNELNNAGLKIFTTIDCKQQERAQLAMRRNLSRLETILGGFQPEKSENFRRLRDLELNQFYYGKVEGVKGNEKNAEIEVSFGLSSGTIPHEALVRYSKLLDLPLMQGWEVQLKKLLQTVKNGDIVFVEVRDYDKERHFGTLELHKSPKINGGLVSLDKGEVRVAVSGFDTMGFNRAIFARRQPGSVFKSVVYYAAMQLGWNLLDILDNERQIFPYQSRFYFPRPDHVSPYRNTSMVWSGTMSENLASVSLANRILDKLNFEQFKLLMASMDLTPKSGESAPDFHFRVAKATGVQLDNDGVREYQLNRAVADISPDLVFKGQSDAMRSLEKMWWGKGYIGELSRLFSRSASDMPPLENAMRVNLVKNNYVRLKTLAANAESDWAMIEQKVSEKGADAALRDPALAGIWKNFKVLPTQGNRPALGFISTLDGEMPSGAGEHYQYIDRLATVQGRPLNTLDVEAIWGEGAVPKGDLRLNGTVPLSTFQQLDKAVDERYQTILSSAVPYDLNRYYEHHDFRISLGLKYLVEMVKAMGVTSKVEPVPSFPLGTNDVTAAEVAKIYQTFVEGKIYRFYEKGPANQINFIRRIEDRHGSIVFEPKRKEAMVALPEFSPQMHEILKRVVTHGTGRPARGELYLQLGDVEGAGKDPVKLKELEKQRVRVQAFGKTGTTNDYTNAYFAGFFPVPTQKGQPLDFHNFYTIASYVGYDLNKMMRRGGIKVTGGLGALPTWIEYAKGMMDVMKYKEYLDELDINVVKKGEWPMKYDEKLSIPLGADLARGVVLNASDGDNEVFETTNIAKTGESYFNEFAVGSTVKAVVRAPSDGKGGIGRFFSPFNFKPELKDSQVAPAVRVDSVGSPTIVPDAEGTANAELLPGAKASDIKDADKDEILDEEGLIIKGEDSGRPPQQLPNGAEKEKMNDGSPSGAGNSERPGSTTGTPAANPKADPKSDSNGTEQEGDLW
ncbi:MAG: transglycosylase domain-containing protein [Proteobacteria bacterium]|nr:transglycosylase domain-containing protein [Pseudomonadota bacterium]